MQYGFNLVPRPWAFVACTTKFAQRLVLQATNAQSLGTRLLELPVRARELPVRDARNMMSRSHDGCVHGVSPDFARMPNRPTTKRRSCRPDLYGPSR